MDVPRVNNPTTMRPIFPSAFITFQNRLNFSQHKPMQPNTQLARPDDHSMMPALHASTTPVNSSALPDYDQLDEKIDDEMLHELTQQAMGVNLFTPELPQFIRFSTNKNVLTFGIA